MRLSRLIPLIMAALAVAVLAGGCGVRAWQRDVLAKPEMQMDSDHNQASIDDHIYFSKEAASGGRGFGGGGCGCN